MKQVRHPEGAMKRKPVILVSLLLAHRLVQTVLPAER
jgi:hypothetical protein